MKNLGNVLLTGSSGFLGKNLYKKLILDNNFDHLMCLTGRSRGELDWVEKNRITFIRGNINTEEVLWEVRDFLPDVVFHLAGLAGSNYPEDDIFGSNTFSTFNLLNNVPKGCRFILASSSTVYGDGLENYPHIEINTLHPTSIYGASKAASEQFLHSYTKLEKVNGVALRFCANVGPGATHGLVRDILKKLNGPEEKLQLWGKSPGSKKPFIHTSDSIRALLWFVEKTNLHGAYNVCNEGFLSVLGVQDIISKLLGRYKEIEWLEDKIIPGDNKMVNLSNSKLLNTGFSLDFNSTQAIFWGSFDLAKEMGINL